MLSFCLRVILWCFSFVKAHYKWFLLIHVVYAVWIARYMSNLYNTKIKAYLMLPEELQKSPFMRKDCDKIKKWKLILGGIYLLPWRFTLTMCLLLGYYLVFLIVPYGYDPEKPYPKWRRWMIRRCCYWLSGWYIFFNTGCWNIKVIKKRIREYDPEYPPQTKEDLA